MEKDCILELLVEERMSGALEHSLRTNQFYNDASRKIDKQENKLSKMKLNKKQKLAVDRLLSSYNFNSSEYGRAAYRQGFKDCLILLQEIDQLKNII